MLSDKPKASYESASPQFDQHIDDGRYSENSKTPASSDFYELGEKTSSSFVTITELPINGYLSIDGNPIYFYQKVLKEDIKRLLFTLAGGIKRNYYGDFKFTTSDSRDNYREHSFIIDVDIINNTLEIP
ncbi:MAG: hypothetical protein HOH19_10980 [Kordiimonadaceae bacterium]|jgi:hypothetical protein|nr:hypothetical protein [Kordiimonadaceae bacterium]